MVLSVKGVIAMWHASIRHGLAVLVVLFALGSPADNRIALGQVIGDNMHVIGRWDEHSGAYSDIWAEGDYAYLGTFGQNLVYVLDISDPANPVLASVIDVPAPNNSTSAQDVKAGDGLLFIGLEGSPNNGASGVVIMDIRDPTAPRQVATIAVPNFERLHNMFYDNGYLYLANSSFPPMVSIVDLTSFDPDNPPPAPITNEKWRITDIGSSFVHDITVQDGRMYAAAWDSGLWIYDVSDVANTMPTFLGSVGGNNTHSMWATDDGRFVVTGEERGGGGIKVYEITDNGDSLTLTLRDSLAKPGEAFSVHNQVIIGNRLYNAWYEAGIHIFDINPKTGMLESVASIDTPNCWGIYPFLGDDRILASDMAGGLFVLSFGLPLAQPPVKPAGPDGQRKNRFISIKANNPDFPIVMKIELLNMACSQSGDRCADDADCAVSETCDQQGPPVFLGWVDEPFEPATAQTPAGTFTARVVKDQPPRRIFSEPVIHVGDCEIAPARTYAISASVDGVVFSDPLVIGTIKKPDEKFYGDVVGEFDGTVWTAPNGITSVNDVVAWINFVTFKPAPHITVLDLASEQPNFVINATDLGLILQAFESRTYPPPAFANQGGPENCP